jgi:hypothetical protein
MTKKQMIKGLVEKTIIPAIVEDLEMDNVTGIKMIVKELCGYLEENEIYEICIKK